MGDFDNMLNEDKDGNMKKKADQIEISCPLFLRPLMKQILSVGKSIKIIRHLEKYQLKKAKKNLGYRGIDFETLILENVKMVDKSKAEYSLLEEVVR